MTSPATRSAELGALPTLLDCVHCGLCVPACPTHRITGREADSPRGRIAALRAVAEGREELTPGLRDGLENCLVCRACESTCPSGISMEALIGGFRAVERPRQSDLLTKAEHFFLRHVLPYPRRIAVVGGLLRVTAPLVRALSLPLDLPHPTRLGKPEPFPIAIPEGDARGTVAMFRGCIADRWFRAETNAAARVLSRSGWRVVFPEATCCGALYRHAGEQDAALAHARRSATALMGTGTAPDYIVCDAAGCAAALAEPESDDPKLHEVATRVIDTPGLLAKEGWTPPSQTLPGNWIAAPPCHHRHGPLDELGVKTVLGATLSGGYRELPPPEHCCGAAGLYHMRRPKLSRSIGAESAVRFEASGADGVITGNPGCQLRWESLLGKARVLHPVVAVEQAYGSNL